MQHTEAVYKLIEDTDMVLDVGSAAQPFNRANVVIDVAPYESRNPGKKICEERFTKESWIQQDICDFKKPWPFKDKAFDFIVCGHVFEDIRDPVFSISEMIRVGKKGYIEVPSRYWEQMMGLEFSGVCGFAHHRWIIDSIDNKIRLTFKSHELHSNSKWHIEKKGPWPHLNRNHANLGLFWEGDVEVFEDISLDLVKIREYFSETTKQAKNISDLYEIGASTPSAVENPFKYDGKPHVTIFKDNISDEEFWENM